VTAADSAKKTTTARRVAASVCLGCHTPDQTGGDFDYATFMKAVVGPGHGA
jgi:mono/diheme cytochrome c family protein